VPSLRVYWPFPWRRPSRHSPEREVEVSRQGEGEGETDVDVAIGEVVGAGALHLALHPLSRVNDLPVPSHPDSIAVLSPADLTSQPTREREAGGGEGSAGEDEEGRTQEPS
jgi:hypothetical protein